MTSILHTEGGKVDDGFGNALLPLLAQDTCIMRKQLYETLERGTFSNRSCNMKPSDSDSFILSFDLKKKHTFYTCERGSAGQKQEETHEEVFGPRPGLKF